VPRKPAKRASVLIFPKHGKVTREDLEWPRTKEEQEETAVDVFVALLEEWNGRKLTDIRPLPERDQDVEAREGETRVEIQVTELVTRDFVIDELGPGAFQMDMEGLKDALANRIQAKIDKHYQKPAGVRLILLVYSLDPGASEFLGANVTQPEGPSELEVPEGLVRAQRLAAANPGPFDEIWYVVPGAGFRPGFMAGVLPPDA
jgi:hypothetical protein